MRNKVLTIATILTIAISTSWSIYLNESNSKLSDLALANLTALARGEDSTDPNLGKGMVKEECKDGDRVTGTRCTEGSPTDECHYLNDVQGDCN